MHYPEFEVRGDYHPGWVEAAKSLGGRWNGTAWTFNPSSRAQVEEAYRAIYGDPREERVTVRIGIPDGFEGRACTGSAGASPSDLAVTLPPGWILRWGLCRADSTNGAAR